MAPRELRAAGSSCFATIPVPIALAVLFCSTAPRGARAASSAGLGPVPAAAEAIADDGCGASCPGDCFAGHCLVHPIDIGPEYTVQASNMIASGSAPAPLLRDAGVNGGFQLIGPSMGDPAAVGGDLVDRLQLAEVTAAHLKHENTVLREQLERWHQAGRTIANHEARLAQFLAQVPGRGAEPDAGGGGGAAVTTEPPPLALVSQGAAVGATSLAGSAEPTAWAAAGWRPRLMPIGLGAALVLLAAWIFCFKDTVMLLLLGSKVRAKNKLEERPLEQAAAWTRPSDYGSCFAPLGRRIGIGGYAIEVSELRLGHLGGAAASDGIGIRFQLGMDQVSRTRTAPRQTGDFMTFNEVIRLNVNRNGGACVVTVFRQDARRGDGQHAGAGHVEDLAHAEISSAELVDMARRRKDYFSFALSVEPQLPGFQATAQAGGSQPHVAMRIRDVSEAAGP